MKVSFESTFVFLILVLVVGALRLVGSIAFNLTLCSSNNREIRHLFKKQREHHQRWGRNTRTILNERAVQ